MKLKNILASICLLALSTTASAGLITDTANDSFIDETTGLEWIDFGVNNNQSFNYVSSQLGIGGEYEGWRLPTIEEVYAMWWNVADLDNLEADVENIDRFDEGYFYTKDNNNNINTESVFDDVFDIIGYNETQPYGGGETFKAYGFFEGTGSLSWIRYENFTLHPGVPDHLVLQDTQNIDSVRGLSDELYSTLLVRADVTSVPEPSSLAILGLGLLGLLRLRKKA
tara:strand:+ start:5116 stop:5790 length:675 start_codon:yes stop_codon:yes gene_type:complete